MTRAEFMKQGLALGLGLPFLSLFLESCSTESIEVPEIEPNFSGKVIIVGAGAAGLAAGYFLKRHNIDFQIVEASSEYGGRVKRTNDFADFPIDLGAEWIHTSPAVLTEILDDPSLDADLDFVTYNPQTYGVWDGTDLSINAFPTNFYSEIKFKNTTWFGFFEQFIVPSIQDHIVLNKPISDIDYTGTKVMLTAAENETFEADKVLVTVPIKILQEGLINFMPGLPNRKQEAIESISMGDGMKVFIEFSEKFYPDILVFGGLVSGLASDDKIFYDAAFRKDSTRNILGLFTINEPASAYTNLASDQAVIDKILNELDEIFEGKASQFYLQHIVQNWSKHPYIKGSYSYNFEEDQTETVDAIFEPLENKIYFAGEALSIYNQATVHGACEAAYAAIDKMLVDV